MIRLSTTERHSLAAIPAGMSGLMLSMLSSAATGHEAAETRDPLTEIIVTAQKRNQLTRDVPIAIAAFDRDQLDQLGVDDLAGVIAQVPGFTLAKSFRGSPIYTLRGVGFNSPNLSSSSPVGIYVDEIAYPYPVMAEGLAVDLERVEVLKGPQGTLYGRNTTGGLVNNISRKPTHAWDGYAQASVGSDQSWGLAGAVGGGLVDTLAARITFNLQQSDKGWQKSISHGDRLGKVDKAAARLSLLWTPAEGAEVLLTGNWWRDRSETQAAQAVELYPHGLVQLGVAPQDWQAVGETLGIPAAAFQQVFKPANAGQANWVVTPLPWGGTIGGRYFTPAPRHPQRDNEMLSLALRADIDLSDQVRLTSLSGYAKFTRDEVVDWGGWDIENALFRGLGSIRTLSQEVRLSGSHNQLQWIAGAIIASDRLVDRDKTWAGTTSILYPVRVAGAQAAANAGADLATQEDILFGFRDWENRTYQKVTSHALFGQAEYRLTSNLNLTAGLRYTRDKARLAGCTKDQGDNSMAVTWNAFFNAVGIPSNVAPGGCVTYLDDLQPSVLSGGAIPFPGQGVVRKTLDEDNFSGRLAIAWQPDRNTLLYGSVARGFKSGAFPNIDANVAVQYEPARQEKVIAYEAGVKSRPLRALTVNGALFYYDYRNKQVFGSVEDIIFGQLKRIVNIPQSHLYGAELDVAASLGSGLVAQIAGSRLHTRIDRYTGFDEYGAARNFAGKSFSYTPKFQATGIISYHFAMGRHWKGQLKTTARYTSRQQSDLQGDPHFRVKRYAVADAKLTISTQDDAYEIALSVSNLTNAYYWNSAHLQADSFIRYAAMPRRWGLSVQANF